MAYPLTLGAITFFLAVIWGRPLIALLRRQELGKKIRIEEPDTRQIKTGTPTMGGILIVVPVLLITGALNVANLWGLNTIGQSTLLLFFCVASHAILGLVDDWQGIKGIRGRGEGMSARMKSGFQFFFATVIALVLYFGPPQLDFVGVPGIAEYVTVGPLFIPIAIFMIVGTSNAVNLTDGLDSLAGSSCSVAFACYGMIAYLQGQTYLAAFCYTVVGALFAFLWYNAHPAQMFMGDVGSQALGGALAVVALMTRQWLILPVIAIIPVATTISTMLQVASSQLSRRYLGRDIRPFLLSPLHNHFVVLGWSETQIVQRWWLIGILGAMVGIALALI